GLKNFPQTRMSRMNTNSKQSPESQVQGPRVLSQRRRSAIQAQEVFQVFWLPKPATRWMPQAQHPLARSVVTLTQPSPPRRRGRSCSRATRHPSEVRLSKSVAVLSKSVGAKSKSIAPDQGRS